MMRPKIVIHNYGNTRDASGKSEQQLRAEMREAVLELDRSRAAANKALERLNALQRELVERKK